MKSSTPHKFSKASGKSQPAPIPRGYPFFSKTPIAQDAAGIPMHPDAVSTMFSGTTVLEAASAVDPIPPAERGRGSRSKRDSATSLPRAMSGRLWRSGRFCRRTSLLAETALAGCILLFPVLLTAASEAQFEFPAVWQKDLQTLLESAATVADIRGHGHDEVVIAGREELFAFDARGNELWRWRTKARFMTYPAVLSRPGQSSLIYAADNGGLLTCVDGLGKEVWHAQLKGPSSWSASVVCDLDGDGQAEVVQTDEAGTVWAFAALTGRVLWQTSVKGAPVSPAVGDLDGDGKPEVVVATGEGLVAAINGSGRVLWQRSIGGSSPTWATAAPVIFAGSDGLGRVVVASSRGECLCLNRNGEILWRHPTRGAAASTISVGDLDQDGRADICLVTQTGVIYRFDEDGQLVWEIDMQGRSLAPGAILDLDNDGKLEYVLCTQSGLMLVLNNQGEIRYRHQFDHRTINVTPAFGRVSLDSPTLQLVIPGGESGALYCLGSVAATNVTAHWRAYRGDARNSGSWFGLRRSVSAGMAPVNLAADSVFAGEDIRFVVRDPKPGNGPLTATAVCIRPDGSRVGGTTTVLGVNGELLLPLDVAAPGTYQFHWTLEDAAAHPLAAGERSVFLQPFANDRALLARAQATLRAAADSTERFLPQSAAALRREARSLESDAKDLEPLQEAMAGNTAGAIQAVLGKTSTLTKQARRSLRLAQLTAQATELGPATSLVAFEGSLWENRNVDQQLPDRAENPLQLHRVAVPGEHEPVALDLFNLTDHELLVRVHFEGMTNGMLVTAHRSLAVPTSLGEVSWDPLPELDETSTLSIPSLGTRELWLDVDLRAVTPGEHQFRVRLQALNGAGVLDDPGHPHIVPPPESLVQIALRVLPFTLAPPGDFRLCTWGAPEEPQVDDLLAHGNNVFCVAYPEANHDIDGRLAGSDSSKLDAVLARFHGQDVFLLFTGLPGLRAEMGTAAYQKDLKTFLDDLVTHLTGLGFDTNHFALYPVDEPGGAGWNAVRQVVQFGKLVRAANPNVMIYVDGGGELPMFESLAPYTDIWCPGIYMLPDKSPLMELVRKTGKQLWSYNCAYGYSRPAGANLKNMNLVADYRAAALFALRHGATGIGFWCYNMGGDPWGRIDMEYMLVYPGRGKPVTSRRWEAVREGIEDYRILAALRKCVAGDAGAKISEGARDRIRRLLDVRLPSLLDQSFAEMTRGLGRRVIDASNNDATIAAFRQEMLECVQTLAGATATQR
jgi:outer membrane protein assembly factor BamB